MSDTAAGDGRLTISIPPNEETDMSLAAEDYAVIKLESLGNLQANNRDGRNVGTAAMGVLQAAMSQRYNEIGPVESRAVSGVMATPIASPTTGP